MTENLNLQRALLRRLDELSGVSILDKVKVDSIQRDGTGWPVLRLSSGREVRARLLVRIHSTPKCLNGTLQIPIGRCRWV